MVGALLSLKNVSNLYELFSMLLSTVALLKTYANFRGIGSGGFFGRAIIPICVNWHIKL